MKVAIYHRKLETLGGGERVALTIASELIDKNHSVTIYSTTDYEKSFYEEFYGIDLSKVFIKRLPIYTPNNSIVSYIQYYLHYIIPIYLSDCTYDFIIDTSSNGFQLIKKNHSKIICYIHYPRLRFPEKVAWKLFISPLRKYLGYSYDSYAKVLCNSNFTKEEVKKFTKNDIEVIYPPVVIYKNPHPPQKEQLICTVGRIAPEKNFEVMIESFRKIHDYYPEWKFAIVGSHKDFKYLQKIQKLGRNLPIEYYYSVTNEDVDQIYGRASIYWHAKGYNVSDSSLFEHFGISTVEAMSHGCIPVVINKGGQCEIVDHGCNGYRWDKPEELIQFTSYVISGNESQNRQMRINAIEKSKKFSEDVFKEKIRTLIKELN